MVTRAGDGIWFAGATIIRRAVPWQGKFPCNDGRGLLSTCGRASLSPVDRSRSNCSPSAEKSALARCFIGSYFYASVLGGQYLLYASRPHHDLTTYFVPRL